MDVSIGLVMGVLFVSFFMLLLIGVPVSISIGFASFLAILLSLPTLTMSSIVSAQKMITGMDNFALLAIPFFILSGNIMNNGGIAVKLVNFAKLFGGHIPGSLAQVNVMGNMLFGAISGSAVAAEAAIGGTIYPMQQKEGYDPRFCAAVNIASCPTGLLIPPSNTLIVFALVSGGTSIGALFIAGYLPGILMGLSVMVVAYFFAKKHNYPVEAKPSRALVIRTTLEAIPSLLLIVIVIGGIVLGIFTATEGSAIAVVYTFGLSLIYKTLSKKVLVKIVEDSIRMIGIIMFLMAASSIMSWALAFSQIPQYISTVLLSISTNKLIILLIINLLLLVVGTFMDMTPAVLIFTPILFPVVTALGVHPVHFGILMVYNLCIGLITPPVGNALFLGCAIAGIKIQEVIKTLFPYFLALFVTLMLITYIPEISLFLPRLLGLIG